MGWVGSVAGFWPGHKLHIPHPVPGFAFGISQPVKGAAVWSAFGDDQDRCTRPADPPKLLITCQHNQIASGGVLEVWGHRCTVETHRRLAAKPQRNWKGSHGLGAPGSAPGGWALGHQLLPQSLKRFLLGPLHRHGADLQLLCCRPEREALKDGEPQGRGLSCRQLIY